jgi:tripartite-type tricarboxylate transporter receptor subunit TctC
MLRRLVIAATVSTALASLASAQPFPERAMTMIVPFAAGGAADTTGRIMADAMSKHLGQTIVVENVAGAGGATGSLRGKTAKPDGYTIGLGHMGTHAASVGSNPKLGYDPRTDFDYLGLVSTTPNIVFVRKDFPANTLAEFAAYAKAKGPDLKMGHSGIGAASHITCVLLFQIIGAEPTYVAYRGFGQTINDILSGALDGSCDLVASVSGQVQGGAVKAFAVATPDRSPIIPDVPTAREAGMPEFAAETWTGLYVPKGLPAAVLAKLRDAVAKSLADPAVQERFLKIGATVPKADRQGGAVMQKLVEVEVDRWVAILKKAGLPAPQ